MDSVRSPTHDATTYTLEQVQFVSRHGARTTVTNIPDVHDFPHMEPADWSGFEVKTSLPHILKLDNGKELLQSAYDKTMKSRGLLQGGMKVGELTRIGRKQALQLGNMLKKRYQEKNSFLSDVFKSNDISIRSSNIERTILTALFIIEGLFGKENIQGEPLEIEVKERDNETMYPNWYACEALKEWKSTINYLNFTPDIASFTKECNALIGCESDPIHMVALDDIIKCRKSHGFRLPKELHGYEEMIGEEAAETFKTILEGENRSVGLKRSIGCLLNELCENMEKVVKGCSEFKLKLFSGHDTTLLALLLVLSQWFGGCSPSFASHIIFEVYKNQSNGKHYINVIYNGEELNFEQQERYLPLTEFLERIKLYRKTSLNAED
ncbi:lysophosphatidic acid phosphatase type 6-like [Clytia hemisphaerica]|uniref:Uncharacterized protein n=1 Tax=Clytia hemisphaerica TaxID=252671 RepID=A0A7M5XHH4_9CNID